MPKQERVAVKDLNLDLKNYRTVEQSTEKDALSAMISVAPDQFWALAASLIESNYLPTENIIVMQEGVDGRLVVYEGNRRVACLKLLLGLVDADGIAIPANISDAISKLTKNWKKVNATVPCVIHTEAERKTVDRIVALIHGKGDAASREEWSAVAKARHNREVSKKKEPSLDFLENYLKHGQNLTPRERMKWTGDYPLTVLIEAMPKIASRIGLRTGNKLAESYPAISYRNEVEEILHDIGSGKIGFADLRSDVISDYGLPPLKTGSNPGSQAKDSDADTSTGSDPKKKKKAVKKKKKKSVSTKDPRSVRRMLRTFEPRGKNREKVTELRDEAIRLNLEKTPLAFCFVLRSMLEISAKVYIGEHKKDGLSLKSNKAKGMEKPLLELLQDVTKHLTANEKDKEMLKRLYGARTAFASSKSLLSVATLNQLVHNPRFTITASEVSSSFGNLMPLLEQLNS